MSAKPHRICGDGSSLLKEEDDSATVIFNLREKRNSDGQKRTDLYGTQINAENKKRVRVTFRDQVLYEIAQASASPSPGSKNSTSSPTVLTMPIADVFVFESLKDNTSKSSNTCWP